MRIIVRIEKYFSNVDVDWTVGVFTDLSENIILWKSGFAFVRLLDLSLLRHFISHFLWVMEICAKTVLHFHSQNQRFLPNFASILHEDHVNFHQFCFYFYMRINDVLICNFADRNGIIVALGKRNSNWTESINALLDSGSSIKSLATWNSSIRRAPAIRETGQVLLVLLSSSVLLRSMDLEMPTI